MTITEIQNEYKKSAAILGDYALMGKTELANGYCDAEEAWYEATEKNNAADISKYERLRSAYYSALMLRYWYKIFEWYQNSSSLHLEMVDFVGWLEHSLYVAFYYKFWRYENEAIVKEGRFIDWKRDENGDLIPNKYYYKVDPTAPDKIINRCCGSIRGRYYQYYNKDKRKSNVQTYSIDSMIDENGDSALSYTNCTTLADESNPAKYIVEALIKRDEGIEALIIDGITNYDSYRERKVEEMVLRPNEETGEMESVPYTHTAYSFDPRKLVKHLNSIDERFMQRFCITYAIDVSKGEEIFHKLQKMNNTKIYKMIDKVLLEIRQSPKLLECVMP